jgi:hypothetical protein
VVSCVVGLMIQVIFGNIFGIDPTKQATAIDAYSQIEAAWARIIPFAPTARFRA